MTELTVHNVPDIIAAALISEQQRRGKSLDETTVEILANALGVSLSDTKSNGLGKLAGGWSAADLEEFEAAIAPTKQVDR